MIIKILIIMITIFSIMPKIVIIGDSHSMANFCLHDSSKEFGHFNFKIFQYRDHSFYINHLGPITMHRVGRDSLESLLDLENLNIKSNDNFVFCFGEIDVRCHIEKQSKRQNKSIDYIVDNLVENYINTILINWKKYKFNKCFIASIIPPTEGNENPDFPFFGNLHIRTIITQKLNEKLKLQSKKNNIIYLDFYNLICLKDGTLDRKIYDGSVHIHNMYNQLFRDIVIFNIDNLS